MATIDDKIRQFKAEVGNRQLNAEQAKVYNAFTKTKGSATFINVTDKNGKKVRIKIDSTKRTTGSQKILMRHYNTNVGRVTAWEILNLCNVVKTGEPHPSGIYIIYKKQFVRNGHLFHTVLRFTIDEKSAALKSFYSNR